MDKYNIEILELIKKYYNIDIKSLSESNILNHVTFKNHRTGMYRDINKNLIKLSFGIIHFKSEINPNGIGDGRSPNIARTYEINLKVYGAKRDYKHKIVNYNFEKGFFIYARTIKELEVRLLEKNKIFIEWMEWLKASKDFI